MGVKTLARRFPWYEPGKSTEEEALREVLMIALEDALESIQDASSAAVMLKMPQLVGGLDRAFALVSDAMNRAPGDVA